jgi:hypothetical protein
MRASGNVTVRLSVNIWWPGSPDEVLIKSLFSQLRVSNRSRADLDGDYQVDQNSINVVVVSTLAKGPDLSVVTALNALPNPNLMLLSDEKLRHRTGKYPKKCNIFRNYWSPFSARRNSFVVPLFPVHADFVRGIEQTNVEPHQFKWSFVGQRKSDRVSMARVFQDKHTFLQLTDKFNDTINGVPPSRLAQIYNSSHFVLCPRGNLNPDTFRVMEALYAGAIPVVRTFCGIDYHRLVFGKHPFIRASSWKRARVKCELLLNNPEALAKRSAEVTSWFANFLGELSRDLTRLLEGHKKVESGQLHHRRLAQCNPYLFLVFLWVFKSKDILRSVRHLFLAS